MANVTVEEVAKVCHEVNRAYCQAIGDSSQPHWDNAPLWQKESAMTGVRMHLDNLHATPKMLHESWMKNKETAGWKYGPVKDADKKEHPCFMPYEQLPLEQQVKDYLFGAVVHSMTS